MDIIRFRKNIGNLDRAVRAVAAMILIATVFLKLGGLGTVSGVVVFVLGVGILVTAVFGTCLLYRVIGMDTLP